MTRLVAASALIGAGVVAWALWPADRPSLDAGERASPAAAVPAAMSATAPLPGPGPAPAAAAGTPGARQQQASVALAAPGPEAVDEAQPGDAQPAAASGEENLPEAETRRAGDETIYLTIVGDQTFIRRGAVGERADPGPGWTGATPGTQVLAAALDGGLTSPGGEAAWSGTEAPAAQSAGAARRTTAPTGPATPERGRLTTDSNPAGPRPVDEAPATDNRPWPQPGCPWTLGPEAGQSMADQLRDLYGCRYLSSCYVQDGQCTWHYQGGA
jgi:hypothetical protein